MPTAAKTVNRGVSNSVVIVLGAIKSHKLVVGRGCRKCRAGVETSPKINVNNRVAKAASAKLRLGSK